MIDVGEWSPEHEKFIRKAKNNLIKLGLQQRFNIIVDDTNFKKDIYDEICTIVKLLNIDVKIEEKYFNTDPNICIERDSKRSVGKVGPDVINDMYKRYIKNNPNISKERQDVIVKQAIPYLQQDKGLPAIIICDLDGTLALIHHRDPYDASTADQDEINPPVAQLISLMQVFGYKIFFVSGREDKYREATKSFLEKVVEQYGLEPDKTELLMRKTGDFRKDSIIKKEIYDTHIKNKYFVEFVLDDRNQVVQLWRSIGLPTFQVNEGDF
jgi:hypothetical protein